MQDNNPSAILLIHCPDQQGLVASVTEFISKNNGNIIYLDQHVDRSEKVFFMRVEWELADFSIPREKIGEFFRILIAERLMMSWELFFSDDLPRMALFVSRLSHCVFDILARQSAGEWNVEIPLIISNHRDLESVAERFQINFHYVPVTKENKFEKEIEELKILKESKIDFIVLARYMQILSGEFVKNYPCKIINIHHSFLPAFPGAKPYHSAFEKGVKIIGATSHYVNENLDDGPIIEQNVTRVAFKDSVNDLIRKGRDLEKVVLSRAIWLHLRRKILVYKNRTIIFD